MLQRKPGTDPDAPGTPLQDSLPLPDYSRMRMCLRSLQPALIGLLLAMLLCGCGTAFTGGGVPPGRSIVRGRVVAAENPTQPIANAHLTLKTSVITAKGLYTATYVATTDSNGTFAFNELPTGNPTSNIVLIAQADDQGRRTQQSAFLLSVERPANAIVSLPAQSFDLSQVASIRLTQITPTEVWTPTVQLKVEVLDKQGNVLPILPSLFFDGREGAVGQDNTIFATGTTIGTINAAVDTGVTGANGEQIIPATPIVLPPRPLDLPNSGSTAVGGPPDPPKSIAKAGPK